LRVDPEETRNRAETIGYLEHTRAMREAVTAQLRRAGHVAPLDGEGWRRFAPPEFPDDPDAGLLFQDPEWARPEMRIPGYTEDTVGAVEMNVRF
jgi:hypothetical protein